MTDMKHRTGALILAGGEGRRIGGNKPMRQLAGRSLLDHARQYATAFCDPVMLSVRDADDAPEDAGLPLIADDKALVGPLAGILTGAHALIEAGVERMLVIACDCPFLPPDLVPRLSDALDANPAAGIAVAQSDGRLHPAISMIGLDRADEMKAVSGAENNRLMVLFDALSGIAVSWPIIETAAGSFDPFFNVNSTADLEQAEKLYHAVRR